MSKLKTNKIPNSDNISQLSKESKMIIIKNISKKFIKEPLFEDVSLIIHNTDKIALVGQNGTGKTTFARCICGLESYDGEINIQDMKISLMEQEKSFEELDETFSNYLKRKQTESERLRKEVEKKLEDASTYDSEEKTAHVMQEYENIVKQATESIEQDKVKKFLEQLGFNLKDYDKKISKLSGGQKTKLRIAECLCKDADLYILDEPTNNLDFKTISWLENKVNQSNKAFLIISHDRYFLKKTAKTMIAIEDKVFHIYKKNYEEYQKDRQHHFELLEQKYHTTEKERTRLLETAKERRQWAAVAGDRRKRILADRLERQAAALPDISNPEEFIKRFKIGFSTGHESGKLVFEITDLEKAFGSHVLFKDATFDIEKGDKIAIVGENGTGKSTFMKILQNLEKPTAGKVKKGTNLDIGYFDQEFRDLDGNKKILTFFLELFPNLHDEQVSALIQKFGIPKDRVKDLIKTLSGGEKARINLVKIMVQKHNLLLLDEPTNNVDLELIEVLEASLEDYDGTVVFVSHDRQFIDNVATRLLVIENQKITTRNGNYSDNFG